MPKRVDLTGFLKSEMNMRNTMAVVGVLKLKKFSRKKYAYFSLAVCMDILQTEESTVTFKRINAYIQSLQTPQRRAKERLE